MKHINCLLNTDQYSNMMALLNEAYHRADDSILTCCLNKEQVEELQEVLG